MPDADVYIKTQYKLGKGQKIVLSGDIPELGCWQEDYAIEGVLLEPPGEGQYLVIVKLPMNIPMNWKWAITDENSKIKSWETCPNRHLYIDRKLVLIYAPWNEEAQIMEESVKAYEFVPAYVLFDLNWQKSLPVRRVYRPSTSQESSSSDRQRIPTLNKDMKATREKMIELQKKWSQSDRSESMEDFLQSGFNSFVEEKAKNIDKGRNSQGRSSSPRRVSFKEKPSIVGEAPLSSSPPRKTLCRDACSSNQSQRTDRPKSAKLRKQQPLQTPQPDLLDFDSVPRADGQKRVCEYLEHLEGEKKRRETLSEEERAKEDEEISKENPTGVIIELSPVPHPGESQKSLMWVTGAVGCIILVFMGYYAYKKFRS